MNRFAFILGSLLLLPLLAWAENSTRVDGYTIHHNAVTTDTLTTKVANAYRIQRSKNRALVNIAVIRNEGSPTGTPVTASVSLVASNLIGQKRDITLREIREDKAIYYIADFPVAHREQLLFNIEVTPEGSAYPLQAKFQQEFFTD